MVDLPPPLSRPPPVPPEEPGPYGTPEDWTVVQDIRNKRKNFGAGIGFDTGEKIRQFHLEFNINVEIGPDDDVPNLYELHRSFVDKLLSVTEGDTHLTPTTRDNSVNGSSSSKSPIVSVQGFPTTDRLHRKFFHRYTRYNPQKRCTLIRIHHEVLMKETVAQAKTKLLDWLQTNKLWMKAGDLNAVETSGIGWMLSAHHSLAFKPAIARHLNQLVAELPKEVLEEQISLLGSKEDLAQLPTLFVNSKHQALGAPPHRVSTQAVTISCVKNRVRLMKELISLIPLDIMPYTFIPIGLATMENPHVYQKFIILNNDRQNAVQGIAVKGFSNEFFTRLVDTGINNSKTVTEVLESHPSIVSIQETHQSQEYGKYLFIVHKDAFSEARKLINETCDAFKKIYVTQEQRDDYRVMYKSLPHIANAPNAGGAAATHGANLVEMMNAEEKRIGKPFTYPVENSWANIVAPQFTFDKNSRHPIAKSTTNDNTTAMTMATSISTRNAVVITPTHPPLLSNSTGIDTNSTASLQSSSTLAPATQATLSGRSILSNDLQSVVSQMKTMATEQSELFKKLFEQQERQARRASQEARQAAKESREHNQQMMTILLELIRDNKKSGNTSCYPPTRPSREERKKSSPMWQNSTNYRTREHDPKEPQENLDSMVWKDSDHSNSDQTNLDQSEMDEDSYNSDDNQTADTNLQVTTNGGYGPGETRDTTVTKITPITQNPTFPATNTTKVSKRSSSSMFRRTPPKTMTQPEALRHAAAAADANRITQAERKQKIQEFQASPHLQTDDSSTNTTPYSTPNKSPPTSTDHTKRPNSPVVTPTKAKVATPPPPSYPPPQYDANHNLIPRPPPLPVNDRTRRRSPGQTPDNETKLQKTGTAPTAPTTQDETARALNFEEKEQPDSTMEEPDPPDKARSRLE